VRLDDFWALIQDSAAARGQRERTEWLTRSLAGLPVRAIIEFELHLAAQRKRADTWLMWGAAWIIMPWKHKVSTASATPPPRATPGTTTLPIKDSPDSRV
jgi:hypothetical protein